MGLKLKNQKAHGPHSLTQCNKTRKKNFKGCIKKKKKDWNIEHIFLNNYTEEKLKLLYFTK